MSYGQPLSGTELGPKAIRACKLQQTVEDLGWRYVDRGDVTIPVPNTEDDQGVPMRNATAVGGGNRAAYESVYSAAREGHFVLSLGGDHSIACGTVAGVLAARPATGVVWVDAHADINTPSISPSGNLHGMPLAFLLRLIRNEQMPAGWDWLAATPALHPSRLVYIGLRDLDAGEKKLIRDLNITAYTMSDIDRYGIGRVMEMTLSHLSKPSTTSQHAGGGGAYAPIHLSFDIDAVDPTIAPSTGTAVPGGLNYREAHYLCESLAESGLLGSMDMVEVNPLLGMAGQGGPESSEPGRDSRWKGAIGKEGLQTAKASVEFVASALGKSILPPK